MKNDFSSIFDDVATFLQSKGVSPNVESAPKASQSDLALFTSATDIELPPSFSSFFTTFSNGYKFEWESGDDSSGGFEIPDLSRLATLHSEWVERIEDLAGDRAGMNQCVEPEFRTKAFEIWAKMKKWLPFIEEVDGDSFCLDLTSNKIVFDKHDWFDGFGEIAETNGLIAGSDLTDFIRRWASYSFQPMWFTDAPHPSGQTHVEWLGIDEQFERLN